jgi:hypothetical protein
VTRLYVPATVRLLAALNASGGLVVGDDVVVAADDAEDTEYDALMTAAETSALWASELDPGERRRVVVVAEVAGTQVPGSVSTADVVAVHADAADVPGDLTDPDLLGDLCWYATQEIPGLLGDSGLSGPPVV